MKSITNVKFYEDFYDAHNRYGIAVTAYVGDEDFYTVSVRLPIMEGHRPIMVRRHRARKMLIHQLRLYAA